MVVFLKGCFPCDRGLFSVFDGVFSKLQKHTYFHSGQPTLTRLDFFISPPSIFSKRHRDRTFFFRNFVTYLTYFGTTDCESNNSGKAHLSSSFFASHQEIWRKSLGTPLFTFYKIVNKFCCVEWVNRDYSRIEGQSIIPSNNQKRPFFCHFGFAPKTHSQRFVWAFWGHKLRREREKKKNTPLKNTTLSIV